MTFKPRPNGITRTSKLSGEEYWCLIFMLLFSIGDSSKKVIKSDSVKAEENIESAEWAAVLRRPCAQAVVHPGRS